MGIEYIDFKNDFTNTHVLGDNGVFLRARKKQYRKNRTLIMLGFTGDKALVFSFILGKVFKLPLKDYRRYVERAPQLTRVPKVLVDVGVIVKKSETRDNLLCDPAPELFRNLTLNLSSRCNLRCAYCYASGGRRQETATMPLWLAKKAIDYVAQHCGSVLNIGFVGSSEPTLDLPLVRRIVAYARRKIPEVKVNPLSTNGAIAQSAAEWLAKNVDELQVSCDGPGLIQDKYRPLASGGKSSSRVEQTIRLLARKKKNFRVRATVTEDTFGNEKEVINYFMNLSVKRLSFGALENIGVASHMAKRKGFGQPRAFRKQHFLKEILKLSELAEEVGMRGYHPNLDRVGALVTCGMFKKSFFVLDPYGNVSACDRHTSPYDFARYPFLKEFLIGRYNPAQQTFDVDFRKLDALRATINAYLELNQCGACSRAPSCGVVCLYQIGLHRGSLKADQPTCSALDKQFPTATFEYLAGKYLVRTFPYFRVKTNKLFYALRYNDFLLHAQDAKGTMKDNPFITIHTVGALPSLARRIIAYKKKRRDLTLFLLRFDLVDKDARPRSRRAIIKFFELLQSNGVYFRVSRPLSKQIFGGTYEQVCRQFRLPQEHKDCIELYVVKNDTVVFPGAVPGTKQFSAYADREELYSDFLKIGQGGRRAI